MSRADWDDETVIKMAKYEMAYREKNMNIHLTQKMENTTAGDIMKYRENNTECRDL